MKLFLKRYLLIIAYVAILYSFLLVCLLPYSDSFSNFFNSSLLITVLYFLALRFIDDYRDYYKDKLNDKSLFSRGILIAGFSFICILLIVLILFFKSWMFLLPFILLITTFFDNKYIKILILPTIVLSIIFTDFKLHWSNAFVEVLFILLSIAFYAFKKEKPLELKSVGGKAFNLYHLKIKNTPKFKSIPAELIEPFNEEKIEYIIKDFCKKNKRYAVRSSAIDEDSDTHSFAGVHDTYLNIEYADILKNVKLVKDSAVSDLAINYRKQNGLDTSNIQISVLLQEMIEADYAGVINTINPITNNMNEIVISVCEGTGDKLVSGDVDGSTYYVNGDNLECRGKDILSRKLIKKVVKLSNIVSSKTNRFQDIEFVIRRNKVYFLQARAITTYKDINPHKMTLLIDNSNIIESYYGITSPLTFSFAKEVYKEVYTATFKVGKIRNKILKSLENSLANMIYYHEGKIYYNLKSWYHTTSIFPSKNSIKYMESMMGVRSSNKDYKKVKLNIIDILKIGVIFVNKLKNMDKLSNDFITNFNEIVLPYYGKKMNKSNEELKQIYNAIEEKIVPEFTTPILNDCAVMFYFGSLKEKAKKYPNYEQIINECVSNHGNVESALSAVEFQKILEYIKSDNNLINDFETLNCDELFEKYYQSSYRLSELINDYIYRFGSRVMNELKLETITMIENPVLIFEYIKNGLKESTDSTKNENNVQIPKALEKLSLKTKKFVQNRERLRLRRTYVFSVVRNIFLNYGRNYAAEGRIDSVEDIFYLTKDEILSDMKNVKAVIKNRKKELEEYKKLPYYDRVAFFGDIILPVKPKSYEGRLSGIPSGTGEVKAHVSLMENTKDTLIPGNIILTKRTDPGWISLFPLASGLIVEHGNMLSHSFVVAREMGLPAVVGVSGATTIIKDGSMVYLDGVKGVVEVED